MAPSSSSEWNVASKRHRRTPGGVKRDDVSFRTPSITKSKMTKRIQTRTVRRAHHQVSRVQGWSFPYRPFYTRMRSDKRPPRNESNLFVELFIINKDRLQVSREQNRRFIVKLIRNASAISGGIEKGNRVGHYFRKKKRVLETKKSKNHCWFRW
mgnify:FL=1